MATATSGSAQTVNPSVQRQIDRAEELEAERGDLMKDISANRDYLRLMAANGELNAGQKKWLGDFYPSKEKGEQRTEAEVEATRKAKLAARQKHSGK